MNIVHSSSVEKRSTPVANAIRFSPLDGEGFTLRRFTGAHADRSACLMGMISWIVYGEIDDAPPCVCPVIRTYALVLNDTLPNAPRQLLLSYVHRLSHTADMSAQARRAEALVLHLGRTLLPIALHDAGYTHYAERAANARSGMQVAETAWRTGWDSPAIRNLMRAYDQIASNPVHSASLAASAMVHLLEQLGEPAFHDAISALDAMLDIGKGPTPPNAEALALAAARFDWPHKALVAA